MVSSPTTSAQPDLLAALFIEQPKATTQAAYIKDLVNFFLFVTRRQDYLTIAPSREPAALAIKDQIKSELSRLAREFVAQKRLDAIALVVSYRDVMQANGLSPATINRRLAAVARIGQRLDGRVAGSYFYNPAPSEPSVRLTTRSAQASHELSTSSA